MCLPKDNEVCNDTVSPVYIKHDGKIDHWLTDIKLQECKNKTPGMFIKWRNATESLYRLKSSQFPLAIGWRKKSDSYNHKTTIWVSH